MIPEKFFIEAGNKICSSLEIDKALRHFYDYISQYIPVKQIALVLRDKHLSNYHQHVVARVSATESVLNKYVDIDTYLYCDVEPREDSVVFLDWGMGENAENYKTDDPNFIFEFPTISLSLQDEGKQKGGMLLKVEKDKVITPEHIEMIKGLHDAILIAFANCLHYLELSRLREKLVLENKKLQDKVDILSSHNLVGSSKAIKIVMSQIHSVAPLPTSVLICGESGTGKEIAARLIHSLSKRAEQAFIAINCAAIPENLIESELFGYEKGAFTGSFKSHKGRFERANGGTIFLDELGELSLSAQVKLLRVIQELEIERIGGEKSIPIDVRIIAATNRNLEDLIKEKKFREDLYYRLSVFTIRMPSLRERPEDIPFLINHFLKMKAEQLQLTNVPYISNESMNELVQKAWYGNVRELENYVERQFILANMKNVNGFETTESKEYFSHDNITMSIHELVEDYLRKLFIQTNGKISGKDSVCSISGLGRNSVHRYKHKLGL